MTWHIFPHTDKGGNENGKYTLINGSNSYFVNTNLIGFVTSVLNLIDKHKTLTDLFLLIPKYRYRTSRT